MNKKVLLHICCCSCASVCIERLEEEGFEVIGFFYNPNIHPESEYQRRKEIEKLKKNFKIEIIEAEYIPEEWFRAVKGLENEPEGGKRCEVCFKLRLKKTRELCLEKNFDYFTSTLTISPHKDSKLIEELGLSLDKERFLPRDFKKRDGFKESVKKSKELGLYRQNYCGCIFSKR